MVKRIETLDDIRDNTVITGDTSIIHLAPGADQVEALGKIGNPLWQRERHSQQEGNTEFNGTSSYGETVSRLRLGWSEGAKAAKAISQRLEIKQITGQRVKMMSRPSVAPLGGVNFHMANIITGAPCPYVGRLKSKQHVASGKIVKLGVHIGATADVSVSRMEARGAAVVALVDILQTVGKSVDITVCSAARARSDNKAVTLWHVKPAGMRLNLDQLAVALGCASAHRRINFALREHLTKGADAWGDYGTTMPFNGNYPEIVAKFDVLIDSDAGGNVNWENEQTSIQWVANQLRSLGVIV